MALITILGNSFWFIFGGIPLGIVYLIYGFLTCLTIVGIPLGIKIFNLLSYVYLPFGKEIVYNTSTLYCCINLFWLLIFGWHFSIICCCFGIFFAFTIIGIPFSLKCFKIAKVACFPAGTKIVTSEQFKRLQEQRLNNQQHQEMANNIPRNNNRQIYYPLQNISGNANVNNQIDGNNDSNNVNNFLHSEPLGQMKNTPAKIANEEQNEGESSARGGFAAPLPNRIEGNNYK